MESTGGGGAAEIRIYKRFSHESALIETAALIPVAPPRFVAGGSDTSAGDVDGESEGGPGLYLALVQDGGIVDMAVLVFQGGEPEREEDEDKEYGVEESSSSDDDRVSLFYSSSDEEDSSSDEEEGRVSLSCSSSDEEEDQVSQFCLSSNEEDHQDGNTFVSLEDDSGDDLEGEKEGQGVEEEESGGDQDEDEDEVGGAEEETDGNMEEEHADEQQDTQSVKIKLQIWPMQKHLLIKMFSGKQWMLTKAYGLIWLDHNKIEEICKSSFKLDVGAPFATINVFKNSNCLMDFETDMVHSIIGDDLVAILKPSISDFKICKTLGGKGDCKVFKCLTLGSECALKSIRQRESGIAEPREVEIISILKNMRIVMFYQAWIEPWVYKKRPRQDYLFLHLELCSSTLKNTLLPENFNTILDRWNLFEEIVRGVKTLHEEFIVHRDLKPDNIFFGFDLGVRIGDFGDACIGQDEFGKFGGTPGCGTKYYLAPELDNGFKITEKVDIYSVGVIFFELFTPFQTESERVKIFLTLRDEGLPDSWKGDHEGDREFYERMTALDPADRPSVDDILAYIHQQYHR